MLGLKEPKTKRFDVMHRSTRSNGGMMRRLSRTAPMCKETGRDLANGRVTLA